MVCWILCLCLGQNVIMSNNNMTKTWLETGDLNDPLHQQISFLTLDWIMKKFQHYFNLTISKLNYYVLRKCRELLKITSPELKICRDSQMDILYSILTVHSIEVNFWLCEEFVYMLYFHLIPPFLMLHLFPPICGCYLLLFYHFLKLFFPFVCTFSSVNHCFNSLKMMRMIKNIYIVSTFRK